MHNRVLLKECLDRRTSDLKGTGKLRNKKIKEAIVYIHTHIPETQQRWDECQEA